MMKQIIPWFKTFTIGIVAIPVNFLLKFLTRKTDGPLGATAVMFFVLLFANFAMIIPMLFFHKNITYFIWWAQSVALLNILTTQYILIMPCGALLFQIWSCLKNGLHIDARVLVFLTLIFPIGGGIALGLGFSILGGLRYTTMPEKHIVIPALSLMRDLHGAPLFSWGFLSDIFFTLFPLAGSADTLTVKILKLYFSAASIWFSYDVWKCYYGISNIENTEYRIKPGTFVFAWSKITTIKKIGSVSLAVFLASISSALIYNSSRSFFHHYRIDSYGIDTYAIPDQDYYAKYENGNYVIRYSFQAGNRLYESIKYVSYPFHYYAKKNLKQIPVRYHIGNPYENRIQYSKIYNIDQDFDNEYGVNLIVFIIGTGFMAGALYSFPGMAIQSKDKTG